MGDEFIKNIIYLFKCVINLIYSTSNKCILCEKEVEDDKVICDKCKKCMIISNNNIKIKDDNYKFNCYSALYYSQTTKNLILRIKYKNDFRAGIPIIEYMINTINTYSIRFDLITYVPSSRRVLKKRGYNQGEYLAKLIGEHVGVNTIKTLKKSKETEDQIGLNKNQRWENLKGSFKCVNKNEIKGKRVLIVDDVLTTGATAFYCAKELILSGALDVSILTVARSIL